MSKLLREGSSEVKKDFQVFLSGDTIRTSMEEQIVFEQLGRQRQAVWSLLVAAGYLRIVSFACEPEDDDFEPYYELTITNGETRRMFRRLVREWFSEAEGDYNDFIKAMFADDRKEMNAYMNRVALENFSYFCECMQAKDPVDLLIADTGKRPSQDAPERFYHGFVLGLLVKTSNRYEIRSNRESGFGRYDVILKPKDKSDFGYILEFKVFDPEKEESLQDTVLSALRQIEDKKYEMELLQDGIAKDRIRKYGFAFEGKRVLIG